MSNKRPVDNSLGMSFSSLQNYLSPDLGFYATFFIYTSFPHSEIQVNEVGDLMWQVKSKWFDTTYTASPRYGLPYGSIPRIIFSNILTRCIQQDSKIIELDSSFSSFIRSMGYSPTGGKKGMLNLVRDQFIRMQHVSIDVERQEDNYIDTFHDRLFKRTRFWWDKETGTDGYFVEISDDIYTNIRNGGLPIKKKSLNNKALRRSPLALDIFFWLAHKMYYLKKPQTITYRALMQQFGNYSTPDRFSKGNFKKHLIRAFEKVEVVYPEIKGCYFFHEQHLCIYPAAPHVKPRQELLPFPPQN